MEPSASDGRTACVVLAHPNPVMLRSLKRLVEPEFDVVAMADNSVSLLDAIRAHHPELVVMEIALKSAAELAVARHTANRYPEQRVIVIGADSDSHAVELLLEAGCSAFVTTEGLAEELVPAMRASLAGQTYVSESALVREAPAADRKDGHGR